MIKQSNIPIKVLFNYLSFGKSEGGGEFGLASDGDVPRVVEFLFEFKSLVVAVDDSVLVFGARLACNTSQLLIILLFIV